MYFVGTAQPETDRSRGDPRWTSITTREERIALAEALANGRLAPIPLCIDHADASPTTTMQHDGHYFVPDKLHIGYLDAAMIDAAGNLIIIGHIRWLSEAMKNIIEGTNLRGERWGLSVGTNLLKDSETGAIVHRSVGHVGVTLDPEYGPEGTFIHFASTSLSGLLADLLPYVQKPGMYVPATLRKRIEEAAHGVVPLLVKHSSTAARAGDGGYQRMTVCATRAGGAQTDAPAYMPTAERLGHPGHGWMDRPPLISDGGSQSLFSSSQPSGPAMSDVNTGAPANAGNGAQLPPATNTTGSTQQQPLPSQNQQQQPPLQQQQQQQQPLQTPPATNGGVDPRAQHQTLVQQALTKFATANGDEGISEERIAEARALLQGIHASSTALNYGWTNAPRETIDAVANCRSYLERQHALVEEAAKAANVDDETRILYHEAIDRPDLKELRPERMSAFANARLFLNQRAIEKKLAEAEAQYKEREASLKRQYESAFAGGTPNAEPAAKRYQGNAQQPPTTQLSSPPQYSYNYNSSRSAAPAQQQQQQQQPIAFNTGATAGGNSFGQQQYDQMLSPNEEIIQRHLAMIRNMPPKLHENGTGFNFEYNQPVVDK